MSIVFILKWIQNFKGQEYKVNAVNRTNESCILFGDDRSVALIQSLHFRLHICFKYAEISPYSRDNRK